jgi:flagellar biosynthesis protein
MKKRPYKKAAALSYESNIDGAPKVVAKGKGLLAEKIVALAEAHNIPLYKDQDLVEILEAMDLNAEIPPNLYRAVAEVLVFIYRLNQHYQPPLS